MGDPIRLHSQSYSTSTFQSLNETGLKQVKNDVRTETPELSLESTERSRSLSAPSQSSSPRESSLLMMNDGVLNPEPRIFKLTEKEPDYSGRGPTPPVKSTGSKTSIKDSISSSLWSFMASVSSGWAKLMDWGSNLFSFGSNKKDLPLRFHADDRMVQKFYNNNLSTKDGIALLGKLTDCGGFDPNSQLARDLRHCKAYQKFDQKASDLLYALVDEKNRDLDFDARTLDFTPEERDLLTTAYYWVDTYQELMQDLGLEDLWRLEPPYLSDPESSESGSTIQTEYY